jgi:DNA-binding MarR family transcriptional regulator
MPVQEARTVLAVAMRPGLAMGDLSRMVFMSQSLCSRTVAALSKWQRRGTPGLDLIEAIEDPRGRRRKIMYLTPKGRQRMARASEALMGGLSTTTPRAHPTRGRASFTTALTLAPETALQHPPLAVGTPVSFNRAIRRSGLGPWPRVSDD